MKNSLLIAAMLGLLALATTSCDPSDSSTKAPENEPDATDINLQSSSQTLNGTVKNMRTKQAVGGVKITVGGKTISSDSKGSFTFNYSPTKPVLVIYDKSGFSNLQHEYENFKRVKEVIVYLEEDAVKNNSNKSIRGTISKDKGGGSTIKIAKIKVEAEYGSTRKNTNTNTKGYYSLTFPNATPTFVYQYKIIGDNSTETIKIEQRSSIKDSSDIDIIFDNAVGGVNIDSLHTN